MKLLFDGYDVTNSNGTGADTLGNIESTPCSLVMQTEELENPHPRMVELLVYVGVEEMFC